jgi:hypothetical protein
MSRLGIAGDSRSSPGCCGWRRTTFLTRGGANGARSNSRPNSSSARLGRCASLRNVLRIALKRRCQKGRWHPRASNGRARSRSSPSSLPNALWSKVLDQQGTNDDGCDLVFYIGDELHPRFCRAYPRRCENACTTSQADEIVLSTVHRWHWRRSSFDGEWTHRATCCADARVARPAAIRARRCSIRVGRMATSSGSRSPSTKHPQATTNCFLIRMESAFAR